MNTRSPGRSITLRYNGPTKGITEVSEKGLHDLPGAYRLSGHYWDFGEVIELRLSLLDHEGSGRRLARTHFRPPVSPRRCGACRWAVLISAMRQRQGDSDAGRSGVAQGNRNRCRYHQEKGKCRLTAHAAGPEAVGTPRL